MARPAPVSGNKALFFSRLVLLPAWIPFGALGQPMSLGDVELAEVVAGHYAPASVRGGGMLVANAASADRHGVAALALGESAQRAIRALTLVNSAHSAVANGSNVIAGAGDAAGNGSAAPGRARQSNDFQQFAWNDADSGDPRLVAANTVLRQSQTFHSEFTGGILATEFEFLGSIVTTRTTSDSDGNSSTSTSNQPRSETLRIGRGIAMAGTVALESGPGRVAFDDSASLDSSVTVTSSFQWSGLFFDFTIETATTVVAHTEGGVSGEVVLAPFAVQGEGVVCTAQIGSCKPYVGRHSSRSQVKESLLVPAEMSRAGAGRVVAGGAVLDEESGGVVQLNGLAQQAVGAVHVVNGAASGLANGLNVARGSAAFGALQFGGLRQDNQIRQRQ